MHWIKEVEMVDDLMSSSSIEEFKCRILMYSMRQKKNQSGGTKRPKKKTAFSEEEKIAYLIYEYFRVTGANDSVVNYADLFTIGLRNDDIQEFDSKRDEILVSMTKIPPDDILEELVQIKNTRV